MADDKVQTFDIPKKCKGGVVVNEGPDFYVEVQEIDTPEPGKCHMGRTSLYTGNV